MGIVTDGMVARHVEVGSRQDHAQRKNPPAERLAQYDDVGGNTGVFVREESPRLSQAGRNLDEVEERTGPVTGVSYPSPEPRGARRRAPRGLVRR